MDVETANGGRESVCQIGLAFVYADGEIRSLSTYVDPQSIFTNTGIHGISSASVVGAPRWPEAFELVAPSLGGCPLVQHSGFDRSAFAAACATHQIALPQWRWIDSVSIARRAWPDLVGNGGHGLTSLKQHLGLKFKHHDAAEDARAAALVVLRAEATTGLDFIRDDSWRASSPKLPRTTRTRPPISEAESASLRRLISRLDDTPALPLPVAEARLKAFRDARGAAAIAAYLEGGTLHTGRESAVLAPYLEAADPPAVIRAMNDDLAEQVRIVGALFDEWQANGTPAPPAYAWRIAVILRKSKAVAVEREFLRAYIRHFGHQRNTKDGELAARAAKLGVQP